MEMVNRQVKKSSIIILWPFGRFFEIGLRFILTGRPLSLWVGSSDKGCSNFFRFGIVIKRI